METLTPEVLLDVEKRRLILHATWGSHAYGTNLPTSDKDSIGIFILEKQHYLTATEPIKQCSDSRNDHRFYALKNFLEMASNANPNLLDLLFIPEDCILYETSYWRQLQSKRHLFVSKLACKSYGEYAISQIKKAKGCNKRINNPQPIDLPVADAFCKFIPLKEQTDNWSRPIDLSIAAINLKECHVSAVKGIKGLFRLYYYGPQAKGVFRNGTLVCESIPYEDEQTHFIGFLIFNNDAFEYAKRQHKQYWIWRQNRNENRWQNQEKGLLDYDAKNMMHTFRLFYSGINIMRHGEPIIRFSGEKLAELLSIREGKWSYGDLIAKAESLFEELNTLKNNTSLPDTVDKEKVNQLLIEMTNQWEKENER